jgi:subtilase family serine protease
LCTVLVSSRTFAAAPDRIAGPINSSQTVALAKSHHRKAQPQCDRGPVDPSLKLSYIELFMAPSASEQMALDQLLAQQQDRTSPNYHKWLTPQQYADSFGLSQNDLAKITAWLTSAGFQIISIGAGRNTVVVSGTAAQAQRAFGTEIHYYEVDGEKHFANSTPVMVPAALNGIVSSVMGLHSFLPRPGHARKRVKAMGAQPNYYDSEVLFGNYLAPDDIATIYNISSLYNALSPINGSQEKLAVIGQTDVYLADLVDFRNGFNLPAITASNCTLNSNGVVTACDDPYFQYVVPTGTTDLGAPNTCGDLSEADLDLEWSGATARKAQIIFVNSPVTYNSDCTESTGGGVFASLAWAIDPGSATPLAPVVSMSYGICEADDTTDLTSILQQAGTEGVTIVNSAGDTGSAACDATPPNNAVNPPFSPAEFGLAVNYPASSPDVTGVGGTGISLADDSYPTQNSTYWSTTLGPNGGTAKMYIPEIAWNDNEEWAAFCQSSPASPSNDFCTQGGSTAVPGWVVLTSAATAAQVQSDIWVYQGGGGASNCWYENSSGECLGSGAGPTAGGGFAQPTYQQGLSVTGAPAGVRYVPDVSLLASPNFPGYIFCTAQSEFVAGDSSASSCANGIATALNNGSYISVIGGTSASTPTFAGIVTLLNQYLVGPNSAGLGNINTQLYALAASTATSSTPAFHQDITGDNMVYCQPNTPTGEPSNIVCPSAGVFGFLASNKDTVKGTGYNLVTGLGSVNAYNLALAWAASEGSATATTMTSSHNPAIQGATVTLTATVTTTGSDQPTGTVTFYNGTTNIGSGTLATVSGAQVATLAIDSLPVGTDSITADYGGDSNNARSTSPALTQIITAVTTTTAVTSSLNPANYGAAVTFTATVTTTGSIKPNGQCYFLQRYDQPRH